jgi:hypothetical protein
MVEMKRKELIYKAKQRGKDKKEASVTTRQTRSSKKYE